MIEHFQDKANRSQQNCAGACFRFKHFKALLLLACMALLFSCTKDEKPAETTTPQKPSLFKVELIPAVATKNNSITAKVKGVNPADLSYQWIVNGKEIEEATERVLQYPYLKKNDSVQVKAYIKGQEQLVSDTLIISNIIPLIQTANLLPQDPKKGDEIRIEYNAYDKDNDFVSLSYEWFLNDESLDEASDILYTEFMSVKRGDKISVKLIPSDGEQEGRPLILYTFIANQAPNVNTDIKAEIKGLVYTSKVIAEDPEGDPLTYTLVRAPEGMIIDPATGVITWELTPEDAGVHEVTISVKDDQGGKAIVPLSTTITFEFPE